MDMLKGLKAQNTVFGGSDSKQKLRTMMTNGVKTASCRNTREHTEKKFSTSHTSLWVLRTKLMLKKLQAETGDFMA